jgi:hypothetical protein
MLAPLATIAFLSALWLAIVAVARTLERSGSTIMAALAGQSPLATPKNLEVPIRMTNRAAVRQQRPMRATPRLRDAA